MDQKFTSSIHGNELYHTVRTIQIYNQKIVERESHSIPRIHSLSWLGTDNKWRDYGPKPNKTLIKWVCSFKELIQKAMCM